MGLWAWLAADGHEDDVFLAAAGEFAGFRAWLAADGQGGDVFLFAAGERTAADGRGGGDFLFAAGGHDPLNLSALGHRALIAAER